jgi:serine protease Do
MNAIRKYLLAPAIAAALAAYPAANMAVAQQPKKDRPSSRPQAPIKSSPQLLSTFKPVTEKAAKSTLRVLVDGKDAALATVVSSDGYLLTKYSEIREGKISVKVGDKEMPAKLIAGNEVYDLATMKIDATDLTPIEWTASRNGIVGNWVAAAGPIAEPVAVGVVSVATRDMNPPYGRQNVPTEKSGFLGILLATDSAAATIGEVTKDSAADKAGLKARDIIMSIDGQEITNQESLINTLSGMKAGDKVKIVLDREGKKLELTATLGGRPKDAIPKGNARGDMQNSMGSVLSLRRTGFPSILQHDLVIKPSDCGGPLVDLDGRVLGINIARAGRVESYAIPSEHVMVVLPVLMSSNPIGNPNDPIADARAALKRAESMKIVVDRTIADAKKKLDSLLAEEKWWKDHPKEKGPDPRVLP